MLNIGPDITPRAAMGDKGYSSKANCAAARARGMAPVIPHGANEKNTTTFFAKALYKARSYRTGALDGLSVSNASLCDVKDRTEFPVNRQLRCRPMLD